MNTSDKPVSNGSSATPKQKTRRILVLAWSAAEVAARQFITLGFSFGILALITPHDLGIFTLAYAVNQIPSVLLDEPIIDALIQRHDASVRDWDTGFTANFLMTAGSLALLIACRGWIADLLHEPELRLAVPAIAACSLLGALGYVQKGFLARELQFATMARTMLTSQVIAGVVGVGLALGGCGFWALVGNLTVFTLSNAISFWIRCSWKPKLVLDLVRLRSLAHYTIQSMSVRFVILVRDSGPPVVVGAFFDATAIGYFALAFRIARTLGLFFEDMSRQPLMALMSREQKTPREFSQLLLNIVTVMGVAALPAFVGLALVGSYLPGLVFGPSWAPSGRLLPWLCIIVAGWVVLHVMSVSLRAQGRVQRAFLLLAPLVSLDLICLVTLAPFGIVWALIGMSARMVLSLPLLAITTQHWLGLPIRVLLGSWTLPFIGVVSMIGIVFLILYMGGSGLLSIIASCVCGAVAYIVIVTIGVLTIDRRITLAFKAIG